MAELLPRDINRRIGRAMHAYDMLADGDRVLVAVSGGTDSLLLAWLLDFWRKKAPISFALHAVHIDMDADGEEPGPAARAVRRRLVRLGYPVDILAARWQPAVDRQSGELPPQDTCYLCARARRKQLFDHAARLGMNRIALGHHRDDIIETFFLNLCFAGNISTMVPRQDLFAGKLSLIRPLAFIDKVEIEWLAGRLGFTPVPIPCPLGEQTSRREIRDLLQHMYQTMPQAKTRIFAALSNVRHDYLLKPAPRQSAGREA